MHVIHDSIEVQSGVHRWIWANGDQTICQLQNIACSWSDLFF